jgi:hypothetical protein
VTPGLIDSHVHFISGGLQVCGLHNMVENCKLGWITGFFYSEYLIRSVILVAAHCCVSLLTLNWSDLGGCAKG